jgi:hypothetical protein
MSEIQYEETHRPSWNGKDIVTWLAICDGWKVQITSDFYVTILNFEMDGGRIAQQLSSLDAAKAFVQQQFTQMAGRGISYASAYISATPGSDRSEEGKGALVAPTPQQTIPANEIEYVDDGSYFAGWGEEPNSIPVRKAMDVQDLKAAVSEVTEDMQITEEDVEAAWFADKYDGYGNQWESWEELTTEDQDKIIRGRELLKHYKLVRGQRSMYPSPRGLEKCVATIIVPSGHIAGSEVSVYVGLAPKVTSKGKALNLYIPAEYPDKINQLMAQLTAQGVDLTDQRGNQSISSLLRYLVDKALSE